MKLLALLSLGAAVAASPAVVDRAPQASISKTDGLKFNIDGQTKYYAGTNSYWMPFFTNDHDVDVIMGHLATSGQKILRIWGFNDVKSIPGSGTVYFQYFSGSTATINTGANGLQRLDAVVKSAEKHGIKLIINFVNNWTDYGYVPTADRQ
jgi:mannan endo-1,4-beta-mannosidase